VSDSSPLPLLVGFAESRVAENMRAQAAGETLTVVLEWFMGFPIQREPDKRAV